MEVFKVVPAAIVLLLGIHRLYNGWKIWITWSEVKIKSVREKYIWKGVLNYVLGCCYVALSIAAIVDILGLWSR